MSNYRLRLFVALASAGLGLTGASAQDDWRSQYSVGDQVQFTISARQSDLQPCTVVENDPASQMRVQCDAFKAWSAGIYMVYNAGHLATGKSVPPPPPPQPNPTPLDQADFPGAEWRAKYPVGHQVSFTASGRASDAQPCTVSDNTPGSVMRVACEAFGQWRAGEHIVYAAENVDGLGRPNPPSPPPPPPPAPTPLPGGDQAELQLGNWGCWGTGGQIMAGLSFDVLAGHRYVDSAGNEGTYYAEGTDIVFLGGILDGERMESLGGQSYAIANQAECNPF